MPDIVHLSSIAGSPLLDSSGDRLGKVDDVVARIDEGDGEGRIVTAGGRVLNVTALGAEMADARDAAYAAANMIEFRGMQLRRDIALRAVR